MTKPVALPSGIAVALALTGLVLAAPSADAQGNAVGGSGSTFYLNDMFDSVADNSFTFGDPGDTVYYGDWNGDGIDTPMIRRGGQYTVSNSNSNSMGDYVFYYGNPDDIVLVGDWNGDGVDTLTVRRGGEYTVSNSNMTGWGDYVFWYGNPGDNVLVGDWNGDGKDTIGISRGTNFQLRNEMSTGAPDIIFDFGQAGDIPFVGDFNGDGRDTIGLRRPPAAAAQPTGSKWIDINLSKQQLTAYVGSTVVFGPTLVSTGTAANPTATGTFSIYLKYTLQTMRGTYGVQPDVPWVMYFTGPQAIHGAYWHNNFGHVMSHGCVNMRVSEAKWLFEWAPLGTKVVVHY
jgi:hypothetical protein